MPVHPLVLLIDADNLPSSCAEDLVRAVTQIGIPVVRRAYGDWSETRLAGWRAVLSPLAIQPVQQAAGKNATDIAMVIDAMDLLHLGQYRIFALASNDADFTRLALRLREAGKEVVALGTHIGASFAAASSRVVELRANPVVAVPQQAIRVASPATNPPATPVSSAPAAVPAPKKVPAPAPPLRPLLTRVIQASNEEWAAVGWLGHALRKADPEFNHKRHRAPTLSQLLRQQGYLEVAGEGADMKVRVRPKAA